MKVTVYIYLYAEENTEKNCIKMTAIKFNFEVYLFICSTVQKS